MKIKGNNSNFEACPEFTGKAVCVDVTPLRKQQSQFGERDVFKLVLEVDLLRPAEPLIACGRITSRLRSTRRRTSGSSCVPGLAGT